MANKKCRKLKMGAVDFSDATSGPIKRISFWAAAIRRKKKIKVSSRMLTCKKKAAKIKGPTGGLSLEEMIIKLQEARRDYRAAEKKHRENRVSFLDTLEPSDKKRLLVTEEMRRQGRMAKRITGKLASKSVTRVIVDGQICTAKDELDAIFLEVNHAKMHASEDTPFMIEPLVSVLGYKGDPAAMEAI